MKELDLDLPNTINWDDFKSNFLDNSFLIKSNNIKLAFTMYIDNIFSEKLIQEQEIILRTLDKGDGDYYIISIRFKDKLNNPPNEIPNTVYIPNVARKDGIISGTESIQFALKILQKIKEVKVAYLNDGSRVKCDNNETFDLTLYRLLTQQKTFYNKFGFKLWYRGNYIQDILEKYAKIVSNYSITNILEEFDLIINKLESSKLPITYKEGHINEMIYTYNSIKSHKELNDVLSEFKIIYNILNRNNKLTFGKTVEYLHKDNNSLYQNLMNFFSMDNKTFFNKISFEIENNSYYSIFLINIFKMCILRYGVMFKGYYVKEL